MLFVISEKCDKLGHFFTLCYEKLEYLTLAKKFTLAKSLRVGAEGGPSNKSLQGLGEIEIFGRDKHASLVYR